MLLQISRADGDRINPLYRVGGLMRTLRGPLRDGPLFFIGLMDR